MFEQLFDSALVESVVRALIPILLAALGGMICDRAGVFQISLEGMMLVGAFTAVAGSYLATSATVGTVIAMAAGSAFSLVLAYGAVSRQGDPIVIGVAVNLLALGLTSFLLPQLFGVRGVFQDPRVDGLNRFPIPFLSDIPIVGPAIFRSTIPGYLAMLAVPALWVFLFRTPIGLRLRGVGERPVSAETLGVNPTQYKYAAVVASGMLCGLAGAQLTLGNVVQFSENMSSGRGWIAVVAVMLGRAHPAGVLGASALFGAAEGLGFRLQGNGLPVQITDALPYVATLVALALARKRFKRILELTAA
ncbi:MAG: ABC transporter permease [Acidimicrobiia bacterium]